MTHHVLAIDQGTTATTALVVSQSGKTVGRGSTELLQHFPRPGWVSHDAREIWATVEGSVGEALRSAGIRGEDIAAIGIANQRETSIVWDRATRKAIGPAVVWQCGRTSGICDELRGDESLTARVRARTGLIIDPYFSATKVAWILDSVTGARQRAERGELAFGTVESYLVSELTGGMVHVTDVANASRTMLMDLVRACWDEELCAAFRVPTPLLPRIVGNAEVVGRTRGVGFLPDGIAIAGMAGDQQAALFGQACFERGDAKCTYGTGAFVLMNVGSEPRPSAHGLVSTVAWRIGPRTTYALEGSAFVAGAAVQWLRDGLGVIRSAAEIEALARSVASSDGVVFVPALAGLGAPHWDSDARGTITGLTRATTSAHLARATLEGIAFEVHDLLEAMAKDAGRSIERLRVDGGAARNDVLLQFQADISRISVERPSDIESTARGAALLAGLGAGVFEHQAHVAGAVGWDASFHPKMAEADRTAHIGRWRSALERTLTGLVDRP
ncbi:MAG: glycerol kinase GlpK [Polyangiaceae bacterium]|jgi:glycerol kinase